MGELRVVFGLDIGVAFNGPVDTLISDEIAEHVLTVLREVVTDVSRHTRATRATVSLSVDHGRCRLSVADDGAGVGSGPAPVASAWPMCADGLRSCKVAARWAALRVAGPSSSGASPLS